MRLEWLVCESEELALFWEFLSYILCRAFVELLPLQII